MARHTHSTPAPSKRGMYVVLTLIVLGVVAALGTFAWWHYQAGQINQRTTETAPAASYDPAEAAREAQSIAEVFTNIVDDPGAAATLRPMGRQLVERYPGFAPAHLLYGQILLRYGDSALAYDQIARSLKENPNQPDVHVMAGTLAGKLGEFDDALRHYDDALALNSRAPETLVLKAHVLMQTQNPDAAEVLLLEALAKDSSLHTAYALQAELYVDKRNLTMAVQQMRKAIERLPVGDRNKFVSYTRILARYLRRQLKPDESALLLESLTPAEWQTPEVLAEMADSYAMLKRPDRAAAAYEVALGNAPQNEAFAAGAAHWRIRAGDPDLAERHVHRLAAINPANDNLPHLKRELAAAQQNEE